MRHQNGCGLTPRRTHAPRRRPCSRVSHEPFPASAPAGAPVAAHLGSVGGGRAASRRLALGVRADVVADAEEAALSEEAPKRRGKAAAGGGRPPRPERPKSEFEERVTEVRRVTKVVKGGKQISFRAVVIVGDKKGNVGVGVAKAKEVVIAVQKAVSDAKKNLTAVPVTTSSSVPHRASLKGDGAASVVIRPAKEGSGITAGGSVRTVLELAGYKNVNAKMVRRPHAPRWRSRGVPCVSAGRPCKPTLACGTQVGGTNSLSNARAIVAALKGMRTPEEVAEARGLTTEEIFARMASARTSLVGA